MISFKNSREVYIKQVQYLYENIPSTLLATIVIASVLASALYGSVNSENLFIWAILTFVVVIFRFFCYRFYRKTSLNDNNISIYYYLYLIGIYSSASMWGSIAVFIMPESKEFQILLLVILSGLASGAALSSASRFEMFYGHLILSLTPFSYVFLKKSEGFDSSISFLYLFYIVIVGLISLRVYVMINRQIRLEIENRELVKQLEEKVIIANKSNEAKSRFLSTMSHEIRTPMNAIIGFIHLLKKMEIEPTKLKYLDTIDRSSNLLLNVLNDILDVSKIESGKLAIEMIEFNPNEEFLHLFELYAKPCSEKGVKLINSIDSDINFTMISDKLRLKQIITNLLSNALKFTSEGKSIELVIYYIEDKKSLHVEVRDEGIGIAKESIGTILQEFSQADSSTARNYGGTGLGLSIVSKLLLLLDSKLHIESELGQGSVFSFDVGVEISTNSVKEVSVEEETKFIDKRVLVAEDNKTNQMLIEILLEDMDLDVSIANDGVEAEEMFKTSEFDMVLMDINMPNKNGIEAMKAIKLYDKREVPIVCLSANALSGDKAMYMSVGFSDYLSKPIDNRELEVVLKKYLG